MVFLFRDKSIANIFFLSLLSVVVHLHFFVEAPHILPTGNNGFFSLLLERYASILPQASLFILYHGIILLQGIRLNMVLNDMRMYQNYTYATGMLYVLLSGILVQWCNISDALLSNFLLIWIFIKLSRLYNHPSPKTLLFNTGLIVGASVLCYHPTAILILVVLFALAVVRPFRLAEWIILLMGALLPFYFAFSALFLNDQVSSFRSFLPSLDFDLPSRHESLVTIIDISFLVLVLLLGVFFWQRSINRMVIQIRKNWGVMMVMLLILLPIPFIFKYAGIGAGVMSLVPLAAFGSNAFSAPRRLIIPNLLFWIAVILVIYNNWTILSHP